MNSRHQRIFSRPRLLNYPVKAFSQHPVMRFPNPRNINIPSARSCAQGARETFQGASGMLLAGWLASSVLAILIPLSTWAKRRNQYYSYYGKYREYEWKQRQYEEQQNGNYNGYANVNQLCSWWNFQCRQRVYRYRQYAQQQEGNENRMFLPSWYSFFGGKMEGDEREREERGMMNESNGSQKFIYFWTLIMFIGLSIYGFRSLSAGKDRMGLIIALLIFGQFSLINLLTTVQGAVETDGRFFEESVYGWYGQWSVLIAFTDFWMMLHSFLFAGALGLMRCLDNKAAADVVEESRAEEYQQHGDYEDPVLTERGESYRGMA